MGPRTSPCPRAAACWSPTPATLLQASSDLEADHDARSCVGDEWNLGCGRPKQGREMRRRIAGPQLMVGTLAVVVAGTLAAQLLTGGPERWRANESTGGPSSLVSASAGSLRALTVQEAGEAFLSGYVESDGRVTRRDEGGDTVSEGQAYAMLVAAALNDQHHFTTVWAWTKRHLAREDGLLAWRWKDGQVVDNASASDADLDAARALIIAAAAFGDDQLKADGVRLGTAVLDKETVMTKVGRVLVSGSWANHPPYAYNPSYTS